DRDGRWSADPAAQPGFASWPARGDGEAPKRGGGRSRGILFSHGARIHRTGRPVRLAQQVDLRLRRSALCQFDQIVGLAGALLLARRVSAVYLVAKVRSLAVDTGE